MVVKFFSNKKGGSSKAINYLLNHREKDGTARVLQGDPELTRQIINDIKFKQKTTVGCLSFEERNISEEMKYQLMQDFENHLLPSMQGRYNILWVEHTDKGRLELNFVIPKIDLETQKSLNPYYHKADLSRVEKWQDLQNLTHNFTNPKDPIKRRTLQTNSKEVRLSKDYEQLDKLLHNLAEQGQIKNREHLIELLKSNSIEVTRQGSDYLAIKLPDSKKAKRFKGSIYNEQFTSIREIENIGKEAELRVREYYNRDTREEQQRLTRELESYTQTKERELRKKYINTPRATTKEDNQELKRDRGVAREQIRADRGNDKPKTGARQQSQSNINGDSNIRNHSNIDNRDNDVNSEEATQRRRLNNLSHNKGVESDSTRTTTYERARRVRRKRAQNLREARGTRIELYKSLTGTANSIRKQHHDDSKQLREEPIEDSQRLQSLYNEEHQRVREYANKTRNEYNEYFGANKTDFRHRYYFRRNWTELLRTVADLENTSLGLTTRAKRIADELTKYYHENVSISTLNFQQKIFLKSYDTLPSSSNLKSFYISKETDHVKLISYKQKVHIKDYGDKITASNTTNQDLTAKMMIDIAEAKGWDLKSLRIKGNDEFIKKAQAEVSNRLEKKREQERVNQYSSRGYYR